MTVVIELHHTEGVGGEVTGLVYRDFHKIIQRRIGLAMNAQVHNLNIADASTASKANVRLLDLRRRFAEEKDVDGAWVVAHVGVVQAEKVGSPHIVATLLLLAAQIRVCHWTPLR